MNEELKKLIKSVRVYKTENRTSASAINETEWITKYDFDRVVDELTRTIDQKTYQKLEYQKLYNEANDELVKHGIRKSPIITDISRNA